MNELVNIKESRIIVKQIVKQRVVTTSLKVADYFGKRHDHVVRDVDNIIKESSNLEGIPNFEDTLNFVTSSYINPQNGQEYKMYEIDRDGFTLLAMGFTGKKALKFKLDYIAAFNAMEKQLLQMQNNPAPANQNRALPHLAAENIVIYLNLLAQKHADNDLNKYGIHALPHPASKHIVDLAVSTALCSLLTFETGTRELYNAFNLLADEYNINYRFPSSRHIVARITNNRWDNYKSGWMIIRSRRVRGQNLFLLRKKEYGTI